MTWLYGPLMSWNTREMTPSSHLDTPASYQDRKPILKKRSVSETILQHSLSRNGLLRRASAILKAQEATATTDLEVSSLSVVGCRRSPPSGWMTTGCSAASRTHSADMGSPSGEGRRIHFNNEVVQCIAIDSKEGYSDPGVLDGDDATDNVQHKPPAMVSGIAPLPPTKLKSRSNAGLPSPAGTSKTVQRPMHYDNDDDDYDYAYDDYDDYDFKDESPWSVGSQEENEQRNLRLTPSGMFMPYDEGEESAQGGVVGRMLDTLNTFRDIAHVIWNVGWQS